MRLKYVYCIFFKIIIYGFIIWIEYDELNAQLDALSKCLDILEAKGKKVCDEAKRLVIEYRSQNYETSSWIIFNIHLPHKYSMYFFSSFITLNFSKDTFVVIDFHIFPFDLSNNWFHYVTILLFTHLQMINEVLLDGCSS